MLKDLKNTLKQTSVYSLGNLLPKLIGFILLPLYTGALSVSEYGILAILQTTQQVIIGIFSLNLHTSMLRWLAQEKDGRNQNSVVFTVFVSSFVNVVLLLFITLPFTEPLSFFFFDTAEYSRSFTILFVSAAFAILNFIPLNLLRFKERSGNYIFLTTLKFTVILILNIYFIVTLKKGIEGILLSELIGNALIILVSTKFVLQNSIFKFSLSMFKGMLSYGIPLIFTTTSMMVLNLGDRYILKFLTDDFSVGVYTLGYKIASVINVIIIQSFQLGFLPIALKKWGDVNANRFYAKVLTYFTLLLVISSLFLSFFAKDIIKLLAENQNYWLAVQIIPVLCLGFILKGIQYNFALVFHYIKQTHFLATLVIITTFINVGLNFILINYFGFSGAAISFLISSLIFVLLTYTISNRKYALPFENIKLFKMILIAFILYLVSGLMEFGNNLINISLKTFLLLIYPVLLYIFRFYEPVEIQRIKSFLGSKNRFRG